MTVQAVTSDMASSLGLKQISGAIVSALEQRFEGHIEAGNQVEVIAVNDGSTDETRAVAQRARALGATNVRFLPFQPKEALTESFGAADLFVVSLMRGLAGYIVPSKLYGILAAGRASIVAMDRSSEPALIVEANDCGLIAEPGDAESLAAQILTLYLDRARLAASPGTVHAGMLITDS